VGFGHTKTLKSENTTESKLKAIQYTRIDMKS